MHIRVRQLWAPVLSTFLISVAVQFVALRVPQLPPWVFFTRNGVSVVLAPLWMLALPFIGALGAWLSLRAGGNTRDRLHRVHDRLVPGPGGLAGAGGPAVAGRKATMRARGATPSSDPIVS